MNFTSIIEDVISGTLSTVIAAILISFAAWIGWPVRWRIQGRVIQKLIAQKRRFRFMFNPIAKAEKYITFLEDGSIGDGRNNNENTWRINRGALEIFGSDGKIYSRFRYDRSSGQLRHTNEPELRSIQGQIIERCFEQVKPAIR